MGNMRAISSEWPRRRRLGPRRGRLRPAGETTRRPDGKERKTLYLDIKKAHLALARDQDVPAELLAEANVQGDEFGKLVHWLYGCRPAAQAWGEHYSALGGGGGGQGFLRLKSVPVAFAHKTRDLLGVVRGDEFVFAGLDPDLGCVLGVPEAAHELGNRGRLGWGAGDVRNIDMLGRHIELATEGVTWEGGPRHNGILGKHFGVTDSVKSLSKNWYPEDHDRGGGPPTRTRRSA